MTIKPMIAGPKALGAFFLVFQLLAQAALAELPFWDVSGGETESVLLEKARQFWALRSAGDWVGAYDYEEVKKTGEVNLSRYVKKSGLIFRSAVVKSAHIGDGESALVQVAVEYQIPAVPGQMFKAEFDDPWKLIDGQWYHTHPKRRDAEREVPVAGPMGGTQ